MRAHLRLELSRVPKLFQKQAEPFDELGSLVVRTVEDEIVSQGSHVGERDEDRVDVTVVFDVVDSDEPWSSRTSASTSGPTRPTSRE